MYVCVTIVEGSEALKETVDVKEEPDLVATRTKKPSIPAVHLHESLPVTLSHTRSNWCYYMLRNTQRTDELYTYCIAVSMRRNKMASTLSTV